MAKETISALKELEKSIENRRNKAKIELNDCEKELVMVREIINKIGKESTGKKADVKEDVSPHYNIDMHQEKKVVYIIYELREGTVKEIAERMQKVEKASDYDSIYHRVQQVIVRLKKQNKIIATGDYGKKYKLNKEKYNI